MEPTAEWVTPLAMLRLHHPKRPGATAWSRKQAATVNDAIAAVRCVLWVRRDLTLARQEPVRVRR